MSENTLKQIVTILRAKAYADSVLERGMLVKDMSETLDIPVPTINAALRNEMDCARYGLYKLNPKRQRNILWAYSDTVEANANAKPFDNAAGIDPKVQAAEVSKIVTDCENPNDHYNMKIIREALFEAENRTNTPRAKIMEDALEFIKEYVP